MTLPIPNGYPDYNRTSSEAQILEIKDFGVTNPSGFVYPIRYVGNAKYLYLQALPRTTGMRVTVEYYDDLQGTNTLDAITLETDVNVIGRLPVPIFGPYLGATVEHQGGVPQQYNLGLWRVPYPAYPQGQRVGYGAVSVFAQNIAASGVATIFDTQSAGTPAVWDFSTTATSWQVQVASIDYQGNATILDFIDSNRVNTYLPRTINLPPTKIRYMVNNFGSTAATFSLFATRDFARS